MKRTRIRIVLVLLPGLQACLATAPIHPEAKRHNDAGAMHLRSGKLHRAEVCFRLSLEYNPCHADALHNLALVFLLRKDLETAEKHEREALECRPDHVQAVNGLGCIYRARGESAVASELFAEALAMDPGYLDARRNLILTALELGDHGRARMQLDRLSLLAPEDPLLQEIGPTLGVRAPVDREEQR